MSVLTRMAASAGSLPAAISARAASGPSASNHSSAIQGGCECRSAASAGVASGRASTSRRRLAGGAPQDGVDEPGAAARGALGELDRLADRRVRGHAVQEHELEHPEPQRGQDGGLEPRDRPSGQLLDHVVERRAALDDAVGEPRGERAVARIEAVAARLAVQRAVGVGALLEDPSNDRVRAGASG